MLLQSCWIASPENDFITCPYSERWYTGITKKSPETSSTSMMSEPKVDLQIWKISSNCWCKTTFCMNLKMCDSCQGRSGENEQGFEDVCAFATKVGCSASSSLYIWSYNQWCKLCNFHIFRCLQKLFNDYRIHLNMKRKEDKLKERNFEIPDLDGR